MTKSARPAIETLTTGDDLRQWYWLKAELVDYAKILGVKTTDGKFTILERICHTLDTGETVWPGDIRTKPKSKLDWHSADLTPETVITDSYKNSQNARRFFKSQLGDGFKFNIAFMKWMKDNTGKTLADAVEAFKEQQAATKDPNYQSEIAHHNQFNQYTRDFLADNPELGLKEVRHYWALKRQLPSPNGRHVYAPSDLELGDPP
ncbi:DUF6434 domain-containing protein [Algirhabdus cladophorae]|uniref:DUF6434 domain-containing protein n=1 Tax=Algirhabdus cladophorae TaxID=3377108 RepID=UPI003B8490E1